MPCGYLNIHVAHILVPTCMHVYLNYLSFHPSATLKLGEFHRNFLGVFAPVVEGYIDELEATLVQDLNRSFALETWMPIRYIRLIVMM